MRSSLFLTTPQIFTGIQNKFDITVAPKSAAPINEIVAVSFDDGSQLSFSVTAKVLTAAEFEMQPASSTLRGRSVRLVNVI